MGSPILSDGPIRIQLEDEHEGEHVGTTDYFFVKIGEGVPLKATDCNFDFESLPSAPLAVSERFGLIFIVHSSGFYVARTKDVMDSAKEFKEKGSGPSIQQLSLVDVSIGKVNILALSMDNSTVAATISGDIRFFSVDNLLSKEVKQSFSCSLNDLSYVKDMRWVTTSEKSYIVLSNVGKLYYGKVDSPLKDVMDGVDAVEWGTGGKFVAVARMNVISILSAKFEECVSISLSFGSWTSDSAVNCRMKVDSIKWVRPDSIVIGSFQLNGDGKEENYSLHVIRSRDGEITDVHSKLSIVSFYDIYQGLIDDIVPFGCGPHLLLTYLEQCQLAINANRKNTDQHIMLLGWCVDDDQREPVVVDIERDNLVPRIELQENNDDNLVLGLCIDKVSVCEKVGVKLGVEERTELTPCFVLICLTLDGKLVMFDVASLAGSEVSPETLSVLPDEEKDASSKLPVEECSTVLPGLQKQQLGQFQDMKKKEIIPLGVDEASNENFLQASEVSRNLSSMHFANPYQLLLNEDVTKNQEVESKENIQSLKLNGQHWVPDVGLNQKSDAPSLEHNTRLGQFSSSSSLDQSSRIRSQKTGGNESSTGSFTVKSDAASGLQSYSNLQEAKEMTNELLFKNGLWDSQITSHQSAGEKFSVTKDYGVSSFSTFSNAQIHAYRNQIYSMDNANVNAAKVHASLGQRPFDVHDTEGALPAVSYAGRAVQIKGQQTNKGAGNTESLSVSSSELPLNETTMGGKSSICKFRASNEQHRASSTLGILTSEPNLSKQFGNIHEMTKELDLLLRSIEEAGGFRDTCTRSLLSSVEALEHGMITLSENCKMWMDQVVVQLEEVHCLLDKTIQVLARKMYMEGIFKQASDSRYWDLWNRQKLNSELELKQQHILSLNQDLTNQLIELERHFNLLELNKFNEYGGRHVGHGVIQSRYRSPRYIQSLYSVHNAMNSQLIAAENLSESLSKQMAALSAKFPSEEQQNVKKLFETIGIPYEPSFGMKNVINTPSSKKLVLSDLIINKDWSKKNHATAFKGCEPEMSRRRRDSLDQSWTCFEPPKTIVRRMLAQEVRRPNAIGSFFSMDKENIGLSMVKKSPHQTDSRIPATRFPEPVKKGIQVDHPEEVPEQSRAFIWANNLSTPAHLSEFNTLMLQRSSVSAVPSTPASQLSPAIMHFQSKENQDLTAERSNIGVLKLNSILNDESKPILQMKLPQISSLTNSSPTNTPSLMIKSGQTSVSNGRMTMFTSSTMENEPSSTANSESQRKQDVPFSASSTIPAASSLLEKVTHLNVVRSQPGETTPFRSIQTLSASSLSSSASLAAVPSAALSPDVSRSLTSSNTNVEANKVMSTSSASASPSPLVPSLVLPNPATKNVAPQYTCPSPLNPNLDSVKSEVQQFVISNKTDFEAAKDEEGTLLFEPPNSESKPKLGASGKSSPSSASSSGQSTNDVTSSVSNVICVSQQEQPTHAPMQLSTSLPVSSGVTGGKNGSLDAGITDEDEMEEEAPEMSNTTEPSLGGFGGFGISSAPNPSAPKSNPFGGPFSNGEASPTSSTITFSVPSGELFRPASFTFLSSQSSARDQSTNSGALSVGFGGGTSVSATNQSVFDQAAQNRSGQQALGSVLGSFGQSRQLGNGLPASGFAAPSGFGGGFAVGSSAGGFSSASTGGGFAAACSGGGFSGISSTFGGFASATGGFASVSSAGGFAGAASGGFGAFSSQGSGFSAFGTGGGTSKPLELFTQMRK